MIHIYIYILFLDLKIIQFLDYKNIILFQTESLVIIIINK